MIFLEQVPIGQQKSFIFIITRIWGVLFAEMQIFICTFTLGRQIYLPFLCIIIALCYRKIQRLTFTDYLLRKSLFKNVRRIYTSLFKMGLSVVNSNTKRTKHSFLLLFTSHVESLSVLYCVLVCCRQNINITYIDDSHV